MRFQRKTPVDHFKRGAAKLRSCKPRKGAACHAQIVSIEIEADVLAIMEFDKLPETVEAAICAWIKGRHSLLHQQRADERLGKREEQRVLLLPLLLQIEHFSGEPECASGCLWRQKCKTAA